jgi:adenosylcobinamide-GDP ribazoletransferase
MTDRGDVTAGLRFAVTTLTLLPLPTGRVDRRAARVAMTAAPLVGLALGVLAAVVGYGARLLWESGTFAAIAVVLTVEWATGLLHLDGLADSADGLGAPAGRDRLAIMTTSGVGAFGVTAVFAVLIIDVVALGRSFDVGLGTIAVITAVTTGRLALTVGCMRGVPAARAHGLGAAVAGTVPRVSAAVTGAAATVVLVGVAVVHDGSWRHADRVVWSIAAGLVAAAACQLIAVRRIGGITGDVLGASVEIATTFALLAMCVRP